MGQLGSEVLRALRRQTTQARARADAAEFTAKQARNRLARLTAERMQTLQQLAVTQLPELNADTVASAMPEVAAELQAVELQRQQQSERIQSQLQADQTALLRETDELAELTNRLDAAVAEHDQLMQQVAARLQQDSVYGELAQRAQEAEVGLARDLQRQQEIAAEAAQKLPAYESGRLFQYLWQRHFGTSNYGSRGFTRRMDRRLARYIGYDEAVVSYRFLRATPDLVRLEVARRSELAQGLSAQVEGMEDVVEQQLGVSAVRELGDQLGQEREARVTTIEGLQRRIAGGYESLRAEVGTRGKYHAQALRELTGYLARAEAMTLAQRARETQDPTDDRLVAKLREYAEELRRVAGEVPDLEAHADKLDGVADALDRLVRRFVQAEFDAGRSRFRSHDLDSLLRRLERGESDIHGVWAALQRDQYFEPPPLTRHRMRSNQAMSGLGMAFDIIESVASIARHGSGGFSLGGSSRSSSRRRNVSGGGFGGGSGFKTGGGFGGGGGFTTGGGF